LYRSRNLPLTNTCISVVIDKVNIKNPNIISVIVNNLPAGDIGETSPNPTVVNVIPV